MDEITVGTEVRMFSHSPVHGFGEIKTGDEGVVTNIDDDGYWVDFPEQRGWRGTRGDLESLTPKPPTLETMLAEWRDLTARAQAAQAEADALFEHAGQCHGEICVRLAELGWGAPRAPMVPGEPVVTLDTPEPWVVNGLIAPPDATHYGDYWGNPYWYYFKNDMIYVKDAGNDDDTFDPREIDEQDRTQLIPSLVSRPSAQQ